LIIPWIGEWRSCAFLVWPDGRVEKVDLPGLTLATLRGWMLGPVDDPEIGGWLGTYFRYRELARPADESQRIACAKARGAWFATMTETLTHVHRLLVAPIDAALPKEDRPTRVALVTGGLLGMLPLHAARPKPSADGGESPQCWLDRVECISGPSVLVLGRCQDRTRSSWSPILGVIDTDRNKPLPFSRWEGRQLEVRVAGAGGRFTRLLENQATLDAVRWPLGDHGMILFSCHGSWNPNDPLQSGVVLADELLTLEDLLGDHRCDQARLVILSACETALGDEVGRRGDDYLGLPAGFVLAGAKAVVGSLWSVSDLFTALLMDRFYDHLFEGESLASSLRRAQLWLRSLSKDEVIVRLGALGIPEDSLDELRKSLGEYDDSPTLEHPYYWAGFVAYGAAGSVIDLAKSESA
jgi:CHAT domain-containing protein